MVHENELFLLGIGIMVLAFVLSTSRLKRFPLPDLFIIAFAVLFAGWIFSVMEGFFMEDVLNVIEHVCYAGSSVLVAIWTWKTVGKKEGRR